MIAGRASGNNTLKNIPAGLTPRVRATSTTLADCSSKVARANR